MTTIASAFGNMFSTFGERQRQRYTSEPVNSDDEEQAEGSSPSSPLSSAQTTADTSASSSAAVASPTATSTSTTSGPELSASAALSPRRSSATAVNMEEVHSEDHDEDDEDNTEEADPFMRVASALRRRSITNNASSPEEEADDDDVEDDDDDGIEDENNGGIFVLRNTDANVTMTLAELEEERELARRRNSICVAFLFFVLIRLWLSALQSGDFTLLLLCVLGSSWTARWIRFNSERDEELDRRIEQYVQQQQQRRQNGEGQGEGGGDDEDIITTPSGVVVNRNDLRMLSFQAQLSLAIMESQRQMMEGGFGNPDGPQGSTGVSDRAKSLWRRFPYKAPEQEGDDEGDDNLKKPGYGSVSKTSTKDDDLPHCSICLGEYEDGEAMVQLPCGHLFHESCINSWTESHNKCPLCNLDLEAAASEGSSGDEGAHHSSTEEGSDSIV